MVEDLRMANAEAATGKASDSRARTFRRWSLITVVSVYLLILVGGLVRASGSGMGCPDWPKCFGQWVPPTAEDQLPANYQEIYADHGYGEERFNVVKTWTEYVNRLIGVLIGIFIFGTWIAAWRAFGGGVDRVIVWCSFAAFLLVGFQGWLGSVVVATNLLPWLVTAHMLLALVIVGLLIYAMARSQASLIAPDAVAPSSTLGLLFAVCLLLSAVQIGLGTQIREAVDLLLEAAVPRAEWVAELGFGLSFHRTFSLLVLAANVALVHQLRRARRSASPLDRLGVALLAVLVAEIVVGALMYYLAVPPALQPAHLLLAAVSAGVQLGMLICYRAGSSELRTPAVSGRVTPAGSGA